MKKNIVKKVSRGLSLIEILVVVTIFAVLGIIISSSLILTIHGTKKSESLIRVRENLNYSTNVIERNLRNANSISDCSNTDTTKITYINQYGVAGSFSCLNIGTSNSYIASGSANIRLTTNTIKIMSCSFTCNSKSDPPSVIFDVTAQDALGSGVTGANVTAESQIYLRN